MTYVNPPTVEEDSALATMDSQKPESGSIALGRQVLDRLHEYRRKTGAANWEQTIERLLAEAETNAAVRENMIALVV